MYFTLKMILFLMISLWTLNAQADTEVNVVGLFTGKAVLIINKAKPVTLSLGQVSQGVKLLSADSNKVVVEIEGKRKELGMGQAASVATQQDAAAASGTVTMYADTAGHYFSEGTINGYPRKFIVDTGASTVVMNSNDATNAGIDYTKGTLIPMQAAGGIVHGYQISIRTLKLRDMVLNQVDAVVLEGNSPPFVLLGMSALNRVDMKREGIALTLTKKY